MRNLICTLTLAALTGAASAGPCLPVSIVVETLETGPKTNSGTAWIASNGITEEGQLDGTVVAYDLFTGLPRKIVYTFTSPGASLKISGYVQRKSYVPVLSTPGGEVLRSTLRIDFVAAGQIRGERTRSTLVTMHGSLNEQTKEETFVSGKGHFCYGE